MSFFTRIITTSIIFFLVFFIGACQASDSDISNIINSERELKTIKIAVGEFAPFVSKNYDGNGETSEIVNAILEEMGYQPEYHFVAWGEAEKIVRENQKDEGLRITFPYPVSEDRESKFLISGCDDDDELKRRSGCNDHLKISPKLENIPPILETEIGFFYNANSKKTEKISPISSFSELEKLIKQKKLILGYISEDYGYQYTKIIREQVINKLENKLKEIATNDYHNFNNLINNDVDIVVDYISVGKQILYDYFPENQDDIKLVEKKKLQSEDADPYSDIAKLHLMASRKNPHNSEFIKEFNKTNAKLIENKTIDKIKNRDRLRPSYKNPGVVLDRCESSYEILGSDDDGNTYQIPRGTRGLLKDWNSKSKQPKDIKTKATILIVTDPYRGKLLTIDRKCLTLD